jgi:hypothetical protein
VVELRGDKCPQNVVKIVRNSSEKEKVERYSRKMSKLLPMKNFKD